LIKDLLQGSSLVLKRIRPHGIAQWPWLPGSIQKDLAEPPELKPDKRQGE
jgi:hypothetical protein